MCSCLQALKTSLAAEFLTFRSLSRRCFGEPHRTLEENYSSQVLTKQRHRREVL